MLFSMTVFQINQYKEPISFIIIAVNIIIITFLKEYIPDKVQMQPLEDVFFRMTATRNVYRCVLDIAYA